MNSTPRHEHPNSSRVPGASLDAPPEPRRVEPEALPTALLSSGDIVAFGIVLRVDRCAPEHGGGILVMVPGNHQIVVTETHVLTFGTVDDDVLEDLRATERDATGIDYAGGLR
jgi:hypothetical protein